MKVAAEGRSVRSFVLLYTRPTMALAISIGLAILAVVVGEYLGSSAGIGYMIAQAEGVFDTTGVFAGMTVLALGVLAVGAAVDRVERRLMRWKPERAGFGLKELG